MFNIDDALLTKIGYNVAMLTEEQKDKYKREIQEELNRRVAERFLPVSRTALSGQRFFLLTQRFRLGFLLTFFSVPSCVCAQVFYSDYWFDWFFRRPFICVGIISFELDQSKKPYLAFICHPF